MRRRTWRSTSHHARHGRCNHEQPFENKRRKERESETHEQQVKKNAAVADTRLSTEELVQKTVLQADLAALPASAPMGQSSAQAVRDRCKKIDRDGACPCKPHPRHAAMAEAVLKELKIEQAGATNNHVPQRVNTPGGFVQNVAHKSWKQIKDAARTAGIKSSDKDVWGVRRAVHG